MGRHDETAHYLHISKKQKFVEPQPPNTIVNQNSTPPQAPHVGSTNLNQYRRQFKGSDK